MHWWFLRSLIKNMPSAIASKVPGAQGDRYKCRLLEFFAKSLQASIESRYNEGFFGLRTRIYYLCKYIDIYKDFAKFSKSWHSYRLPWAPGTAEAVVDGSLVFIDLKNY